MRRGGCEMDRTSARGEEKIKGKTVERKQIRVRNIRNGENTDTGTGQTKRRE